MIMSYIFKFYLDSYSFKLKMLFCKIHKTIFDIFDKPPERKKNEKIVDYVMRVDKRHALRELDRAILPLRVFKLNAVNAKLKTDISDKTRQLFEVMKGQTEYYYFYKHLKKQIMES